MSDPVSVLELLPLLLGEVLSHPAHAEQAEPSPEQAYLSTIHITPLRAVILEIQQFKKYPNNVLLEGEKLSVCIVNGEIQICK